mmetsp:Transcript_2735/g.7513  ORF Transcript_2735/g.7513 Transcript_2735/m.7513 type:complete len:219 (-) Transcript_2735:2354-3010(-)
MLVVHVVFPDAVHSGDDLLTRRILERGANLQVHQVLWRRVLEPKHVHEPLWGDAPSDPDVARHAVVQQVNAAVLDVVQSQGHGLRQLHGPFLLYHDLVKVVQGVHSGVEELHDVVKRHGQDLEDGVRPLVRGDLVWTLEQRTLLHAQHQKGEHLHRLRKYELVVRMQVRRVELPVLLQDVDDLLVQDVDRLLNCSGADFLCGQLGQNSSNRTTVACLK